MYLSSVKKIKIEKRGMLMSKNVIESIDIEGNVDSVSMEEKINAVIYKIASEIGEYIGKEDNGWITDMLQLDNYICNYCSNSMFDGGLDDIFRSNRPDEGEVGDYAYYVKEHIIDEMLNETVEYGCIDFDFIDEILVKFQLLSKNNCEVSEAGYYEFYDYSKWVIKVISVDIV